MARHGVHQYPRGAQLPLKDCENPLTKMSLLMAQSPKYLLDPSSSDKIHLFFFLAQSGKDTTFKHYYWSLPPKFGVCLTIALNNPEGKQSSLGCPLERSEILV